MYEFCYNEIVEDSPRLMREIERRAFDKVINLLNEAREKGLGSREAIEAIYYLRRLWSIVLNDLQSPENELPDELRAGIISIGLWMMKEIDQVGAGKKTDLMPMIEINEIIRDGLI
jgi:flagellar biosynthesis activator protein FlaF